ncbi:adenylyltransferase/cytidyltransferase family protein [candidate division KSB1 bacterium]|nr:adenylyltransferase/cytidyltransferase family protein [candidate division KSB1 bacterium]NIR70319.1 adenylyltransferase/cytidyltransferase family protein [candidate division KSB1 bacterium]NIS27623.1 adenylyltransferase/cytidyltransferase family protein [candidate division KSB1 bacterium]NIT74463.1 adenylyltransferase/cytidyltransferase family protein [candidate division KSB1 bacterium]NIU28988.1 adenylyltransferase/cytidyltransferase family protein [candidate division KSB1 bacterium]
MNHKIISLNEAKAIGDDARNLGKVVVLSNGCFDLLHRGHVEYLAQARAMGDLLIVGLNSDPSVRAIKGADRPYFPEADRALLLSSLACVDYVVIFEELTPIKLISAVMPDILAKGGDWPVEKIVGREIVEKAGGKVVSIPSNVPEYSTSYLVSHFLTKADVVEF